MSFWKSYRALTPKTRALFGLGLMAWAGFGLWTTPQLESALGLEASEKERDELQRKMRLRVEAVER